MHANRQVKPRTQIDEKIISTIHGYVIYQGDNDEYIITCNYQCIHHYPSKTQYSKPHKGNYSISRLSSHHFLATFKHRIYVFKTTRNGVKEISFVDTPYETLIVPFNNYLLRCSKPQGFSILNNLHRFDTIVAENKTPPAREVCEVRVTQDYYIASRHGGCYRMKLWKWIPGTKTIQLLAVLNTDNSEHTMTWDPHATRCLAINGRIINVKEQKIMLYHRQNYSFVENISETVMLLGNKAGLGIMEQNIMLSEYKFKKQTSWTPQVAIGYSSGNVAVSDFTVFEVNMFDVVNTSFLRFIKLMHTCRAYSDVSLIVE